MTAWRSIAPLLLLWAAACTTVAGELRATQQLYKEARYEAAELYLLTLEPEVPEMSDLDRTRFYYLRGMTAYRLGHSDDALHYLTLTATLLDEDATRLPGTFRPILERTLAQLTPTTASPRARGTDAR